MSEENSAVEAQRVATMQQTDKKCPACGGVMDFDPASGGLLCPYCGHQQAVQAAGAPVERAQELDFASADQTANCDWGAEKKTVICKSCGAESVYDALQVAGECPYCGSNQVMEAAAKDTLAPGGVVPFKIDAKNAGQRFVSWIKGKLFCPTKAKQKAKPDAFTGVYLPYWTFDADTTSQYSGRYGRNRTERDRDGKTRVVTDWYPVSGTHQESIDDALVCGTTRHDEGILRGMEPFNTAGNVAYKPEYVAGFVAERYSVGLKDAWEKAKALINSLLHRNVEQKVARENAADQVDISSLRTSFANITYKYLLLPVWISSFTYNGKVYQFVVNGETGRVSGKTPISPWRVAVAILLGLIVVGVFYYFLEYV